MSIAKLCTRDVVTVEPSASLQHAAKLMRDHRIGNVVVRNSDGGGRPLGILTDRDIVVGVLAENRSPDIRVSDVMSIGVVTAHKDDGIADVIKKMEKESVRRIVLVDDDGHIWGLVSTDDILQLIASEMSDLGSLIKRQLRSETAILSSREKQLLF